MRFSLLFENKVIAFEGYDMIHVNPLNNLSYCFYTRTMRINLSKETM